MTPEERDLRRALEARSGELSPQFRARLGTALDEAKPATGLMQAVAVFAVVAITLGTVGVLLMSRNARNASHQGPASATRVVSPTPSPTIVPKTPVFGPTSAQISAPSGDVVWVLVASILLFRSTDRGATWERRQLPSHQGGGRPPEISFVDADNGWYFVGGVPETQCNGAGAEVWRTTDGAATWQLVAQVQWTQPQRTDGGIVYSQCKEVLSFVDATHGFLGAGDPNHRPTIYRTADGGRTWSASTLPDPPGFVTQAGGGALRLRLIMVFGNSILALAIANRSNYVFRSTDGGATWTYQATTVSTGTNEPTFVTATRWLVIGNDGSGLETTDAGKSWHAFASDYRDAAGVASTFVFGDANVGYGTVRGGLQRTVDGGSHWSRIKTPGVVTPFPTTHSPIPTQAANWPSYASSEYGYSLRYSPRWFDLGNNPAFEHNFSNRKDGGSPLAMGPDEVLVMIHADCQYGIGPSTLISKANLSIDGIPAIRYFVKGTGGQDGPFFAAQATVEPGGLCYRVTMFAWTQKAIESNLADFDLTLQTVRFSSRTAPVTATPVATLPPTT